MAEYFVGGGGNDLNTGLSWAQRFLTLGAAEALVIPGDRVTPAANKVYREQVTLAASGGAGTEIVYQADVTGERTDGIGGIVRITGSNNDQTAARGACIDADTKDYRVFRGFSLDTTTGATIETDTCSDWTIEDCAFPGATRNIGMGTPDNFIIRRCLFMSASPSNPHIHILDGAGIQDINTLIENCAFYNAAAGYGTLIQKIGGITLRNCIVSGVNFGFWVLLAPPVGYTANVVENCIFQGNGTAMQATALGEILEDYNTFWQNNTDRANINVGANSQAYPALLQPPLLYSGAGQVSGFKFPWQFGALSPWSPVRAIAGNNEPAVDFNGIRRPAAAAKNSWGPIQYRDMEVERGTVQAGTYARVLHDAGSVLVRRIPVTGVQITVTLYVRREANYAGNLPRMIIKQPDAPDQITTMVAAANTWEQLSDTFTPNALPGYVEVWLESRNTAGAGNYETFYDTMDVN